MAWQTPKTDWEANPKSPQSVDFNRIEGNIAFVNSEIEAKKGGIVTALNAMNQTATISNTYAELAQKIIDISDDANAAVGEVLIAKTFYQGGTKKTGTMPNQGTVNHSLAINGSFTIPAGYHTGSGQVTQNITTKGSATYTPGTSDQTIASGQYLTGAQTISGDPDLIADNIKKGVVIFGVTGTRNSPTFESGSEASYYDTRAASYYNPSGGSYQEFYKFVSNYNGSFNVIVDASVGGQPSGLNYLYWRVYVNGSLQLDGNAISYGRTWMSLGTLSGVNAGDTISVQLIPQAQATLNAYGCQARSTNKPLFSYLTPAN